MQGTLAYSCNYQDNFATFISNDCIPVLDDTIEVFIIIENAKLRLCKLNKVSHRIFVTYFPLENWYIYMNNYNE